MKEDFDKAMPVLLVHEGGLVDHPKDPGGRTCKGVTQRVYNGYRRNHGLPVRDVALIEDVEVFAIYRANYWDAVKGDQLPSGISYVVFDGAVNSGPTQSVKWLQRAVGVKVDGHIGQATIAATIDYPDQDALINKICDQRLKFLKNLKTWGDFGKGWSRRVADVRNRGRKWLVGAAAPVAETIPDANQKANVADAKKAPSPALAGSAVGSGIATGALAGALQKAQDALAPYAATNEAFQWVIAALVVSGVLVTGAGAVYTWYAKKRATELADALDVTP